MSAIPGIATEERPARTIACLNPATLEVIAKVPEWSEETVAAAIRRAKDREEIVRVLDRAGAGVYLLFWFLSRICG